MKVSNAIRKVNVENLEIHAYEQTDRLSDRQKDISLSFKSEFKSETV